MIAWLVLLLLQESREVQPSGAPVEVRVPVSSETEHRAAVVSFPEESLEALVAGWKEGDLSVERRRENLFLKLLRPAEGDLHVVGGSGTLYRLTVKPAQGAYDGRVRILPPPKEDRRGVPDPVDLIRTMRRGRKPAEGEVYAVSRELYRSAEMKVQLAYVYETPALRGYVARVENVSGGPLRADPSRFVARGLVLAGAREMSVGPGETTLIYFVFGKEP